MENFKFILSLIITVSIVVFVGYWGFSTIESGSTHVDNQDKKLLEQKNKDLTQQVNDLKDEISSLEAKNEALNDTGTNTQDQTQTSSNTNLQPSTDTPSTTTKPSTTTTSTTTTTTTKTSKYQSLINDLQKLVNDKVYMKVGSQGTRVGIIQNFLNIYNKTSTKIDNDYGASTATAVKNFQKATGLTADGQTGPSTYSKMIDWLKKQ